MLIKKDQDTIESYFEDSSNLKGGNAECVALPVNIEELAEFVKEANSKKTPLTISGGGTGTTGSRIPFGGISVSLEKFNRIYDISEKVSSAGLQAGVLVEDLKSECEDKGLFYTSHPTEKTASVGGTVATNASGSRSFKYGPTRKYVKRLKMILANGEILDIARGEKFLTKSNSRISIGKGAEIKLPMPSYRMPAVKNSAGYFAKDGMDLIDLFIGQEGTLSIITDIELGLVKRPDRIFSCFVFFEKFEDSWSFAETVKRERRALSVEYFDSNALRLLSARNSNVPAGVEAAIFFEEETSGDREDAVIGRWLDIIGAHNALLDNTWVAMNEEEAKKFTQFRYAIPEAVNEIIKRKGIRKLSTDIAVPDDKFLEMMNFYVNSFKENKIEHVIFGHIGESHVHVNILPDSEGEAQRAQELALKFVRKAVALGGTISAEHGVGKIKHKYLEEMYGKDGIMEMARIKKALDPNCILGLDNIFPKEILNRV